MRISKRLIMALSVLEDPQWLQGILTWPKFSLTSFLMVSRLIRQGVKPASVIDIGANVGQFAIACAKLLPGVKVYSFEPGPEIAAQFRTNTRDIPTIELFELALGDEEGQVEFHINTYSPSSSLLPLAKSHQEAFPHAREGATVQVKLERLDNVIQGKQLKSPVLLKIDVQGYEINTLKGAVETLRRVDYVLVETSFEKLYEGESLFGDVLGFMNSHGFAFARPVDFFSDDHTGKHLQMDALFIRSAE